jgi:pyruvate kinase
MNIQGDRVITSVIQGGVLKSHKGISIPGSKLMVKGFTEKDHEDLLFGLQLGVDALAISFVRQPEDIHHVRQIIAEHYPDALDTLIVSKLERPEALENLEAIIEASDGVMVARGDLGVELSPEIVPIAQKEIISLANKKGKFVITATQMLESMIHHARPTRAEASDVANAIFDGTDTVMLSGETAVGNYPIHSVKMMEAIIRKAEVHIHKWGRKIEESLSLADQDDTYFITRAARELAHDRNVTAIAAFTKSGRTALMLSKARPDVPIFALTPDIRAYQRMSLYWGVFPILTPMANSMEDVIMVVEKTLINNYYVNPGDQVILVCGFPIQAIRKTNLTLLYTIGEQASMEK